MDKDFQVISTQYHLGRNTFSLYVTGFMLSLFFTIVPYLLVVNDAFTAKNLTIAVVSFALLQFVTQVIFFLHLSTKRWNMVVFMFTLFVVIIVVGGSLWIMNNARYLMVSKAPSDSVNYMLKQNEGHIPQ